MQYHLNGFHPGDPAVSHDTQKPAAQRDVDVLIVGCGPAGLTLAAQLSAFADLSIRIIERKSGPLQLGQADGIACRSLEMFEAFGFAHRVLKESYWVNEVAFWRPGQDGTGLRRADRIQDVEDDLSEMPHVILSQARVHDFYLDLMRSAPRPLEPDYECELVELTSTNDPDYPTTAMVRHQGDGGQTEAIRAKYVVGCDGARSAVRQAMGHSLRGEAARQLWGVMDILAVTDFPDIRLKAAIQSAQDGSVLIIPREGGYLVRFYIELDTLGEGERAADRKVTSDMLIDKARRILSPYSLDVRQVVWWSAYEIGQRVCDFFDDVPASKRGTQVPRIFIAGDACHTHSPKAGQGMNVSMADAFNLGWKLAAVLRGQATPALLDSYSAERRAKAKELIDFDKDMARLFSAKPTDASEAAQFQQYFKKHGRYTAGVETRYAPSILTGDGQHQTLAQGFKTGMRFHSSRVIRLWDGKPVHLGHVLKADGRWRVIAFAPLGDSGAKGGGIARLCTVLTDTTIQRFTPETADIDQVIDVRAVFQGSHRDIAAENLPPLLQPRKGRFGLIDYEKAFCPDLKDGPDIFDQRGIDRATGAVLIIRPDQFVSQVLPVSDAAGIGAFFDRILIPEAEKDHPAANMAV